MPIWAWILVTLIALGCLQSSVRRLVLSPLDALVWLAEQGLVTLARWAGWLREEAARRLAETDLDRGRYKATQVVSAVLQTILFGVVAGTESVLVSFAMSALLGFDTAWVGGADVEVLMAGSVLAAGVHSLSVVVMLHDDGGGHMVVGHWLTPRSRRLLRRMGWVAFGLVSLVVIGLATIRAQEIIQADAEAAWVGDAGAEFAPEHLLAQSSEVPTPGRVRVWIQFLVLVASALALLADAAASYELGVLGLLRHLPHILTTVARLWVWAVRAALGALWTLVRAVRALLRHTLDAVLAVATILARIPAEALRGLYGWATAPRRVPGLLRPGRALVGVLTSISVDLQVPTPSVGGVQPEAGLYR